MENGADQPRTLLVAAPPDLLAQVGAALALYHAGDPHSAEQQARQLLAQPDLPGPVQAELWHLAAACLNQLGQPEPAREAVRRAVALEPANTSYLNTYGVILRKLKRMDEAIRTYERVISLAPDFSDVYYNCGNALNELGRKEEAIARFSRCLELNPGHASAHHNIANCLRDLKRLDEAQGHFARSAELEPNNPDMHCNWGLNWQLLERWDKAIEAFQTAISQKSDHAPSHINLGSALAVQHRFDEACAVLRRGVELDDSCHDAKFNLGLTLLTIGEFEEGWVFYDSRLGLPEKVRPPLTTPMWDGRIDSLNGEPLLVWAEQGYGDNIQFVRYVPILIEAGVKVTLSTRAPLIPLFRECLAPHSPVIVEHKRSELQGFAHHVALLSLPRLCRTSKATVPMMPGYLRTPRHIPTRLKLQRQPFALHIGLVWASGVDNKDMYADKSMALEPLLRVFDGWRQERLVVLHSLQVGADAEQLVPWRGERGIVDHSQELGDFLDTAMVISQLDLVISVDTAVAHVAGAMDKPVWTLLQHNADFRWMRGRPDSPWYPSMTLVRQRALGDWASVIDQVRDRLTQLLG